MVQSLLCGRNKSPPQSIGGGELASISMVSSVSDSIVVVVTVVVVEYVGLGDVVDSCIGRSLTVVNSMSVWSISIMIDSVPKSAEIAFQKHYVRKITNIIYKIRNICTVFRRTIYKRS